MRINHNLVGSAQHEVQGARLILCISELYNLINFIVMFYLIKVISYFVVADCIHMYTLLNRNDLIGSLVYNDNV